MRSFRGMLEIEPNPLEAETVTWAKSTHHATAKPTVSMHGRPETAIEAKVPDSVAHKLSPPNPERNGSCHCFESFHGMFERRHRLE